MDPSATCYTVIHDDLIDAPSSQDLRNALQKGSDEVKLETMRRIIVGTLNGQSHVSCCDLTMPLTAALPPHAYHPICPAVAQQADQEAPALLLGVSTCYYHI